MRDLIQQQAQGLLVALGLKRMLSWQRSAPCQRQMLWCEPQPCNQGQGCNAIECSPEALASARSGALSTQFRARAASASVASGRCLHPSTASSSCTVRPGHAAALQGL